MRKRILVVDDDAAIGEVLQLMLEDAGYEVEIQTDGQSAQQMIEPFPDLLFLDIRVSGADGRAICRHLKSQPATRHIPIILLSAHQDTPWPGRLGLMIFSRNRSRWRISWHVSQNTWGVNRVAQRKSGSMLFPLLLFISTCESFPSEGETNRGMSRGALGSRSLLVSRGKLSSPFLAYPLSVRKSVIQVFHVIAHIASRHAARHTTKSEPPLRLHSPKRRTGVRAEKRSAADALFNACDNA